MRKVFSVALMAAMLCLVGITKDAGATVTFTLEWGACGGGAGCFGFVAGTQTVTLNPGSGQTLRLDLFLTHDIPTGISGHGFSLNFDSDLLNELNVNPAMAPSEWAGTDLDPNMVINLYAPLDATPSPIIESVLGGPAGRIALFESVNITQTLPMNGAVYTIGTGSNTAPARYRVGQAFFVANGAITDGADIFSGLFGGADGVIDSAGADIPGGLLSFGTATVNLVPEPGTVSLLGLGLVGLVLAGRRSRRS